MGVIDRDHFVSRALAERALLIYAPETAADPLENLGKLVLPAGTLKNGAALALPGLIEGAAKSNLDGVNDFVDSEWTTRTNEICRPTSIDGVGSWRSDQGVVAQGGVVTPAGWSKAFKLTTTSALARNFYSDLADAVPEGVKPGENWTCQFQCYNGTGAAKLITIEIQYMTKGAVLKGSKQGALSIPAGQWGRPTLTMEAPAEAEAIRLIARMPAGVIGDFFYFGDMMAERGAVANSFVPNAEDVELGAAGWWGNRNESPSSTGPAGNGLTRTFVGFANRTTNTTDDTLIGGLSAPISRFLLRINAGGSNVTFWNRTSEGGVTWAGAWPGTGQVVGWALVVDEAANEAELFINGKSKGRLAYGAVLFDTTQRLGLGSDTVSPFVGSVLPLAVIPKDVGSRGALELYESVTSRAPVVREFISDKLAIRTDSPSGFSARWAEDESAPINILADIECSDEIPGGYKELSGSLARDPLIDYRDLEAYGDVRLYGAGGEAIWEGSLDKGPTVSGEQVSISPSALGYQYILDDDHAVQVGFIDCDLSKWGEPTTRRKLFLVVQNIGGRPYTYSQEVATSISDLANGPGISFALSSVAAASTPVGESLYYSEGPDIGELRFDYLNLVTSMAEDANYQDTAVLGADDMFPAGGVDISEIYKQVTKLNQSLKSSSTKRKYAMVKSVYAAALAEATYRNVHGFLNPKVIGRHGLTPRGVWPNIGYSSKAMLEYLITNFASPLTVDSDYMDDDGYTVTQAWYPNMPLTDIVHDVTKYGLYDWFVYRGKRFELRKPGSYGRYWKAYTSEAGLNEVGLDSQRLWRKITVRYTDASGVTRTAGALGSGCDSESEALEVTDPDHPAVKAKRTRRDILDLQGIATPETAVAVGRRFLEEANLISRSGSATLKGYVYDDKNVLRPVSQVKSGDYISFVDAADASYRKIMSKTYRHTDRASTIDVDAPPAGMEALLERLQAGLISLGVS
jgi:hypothetical protein